MSEIEALMEQTILRLTRERGGAKSIDPSEAAKMAAEACGRDWHGLLQEVRRAAVRLAREGRVVILRKGKPADPETFKGVYRLAAPHQS